MTQYQHILLPVDFSSNSAIAAQKAIEVAATHGADLSLLHVADYLPPSYALVGLAPEHTSADYYYDKAKAHLSEWSAEHGLGDNEQFVETGRPKKVIRKFLKKGGYDLVILSPNKLKKVGQLLGSVTNTVAQKSKCDVLIVKGG